MIPSLPNHNHSNGTLESQPSDFVSDAGSSEGAFTGDESDTCGLSPNSALRAAEFTGLASYGPPQLLEQLPSPEVLLRLHAGVIDKESSASEIHAAEVQKDIKELGKYDRENLDIPTSKGKEGDRGIIKLSPAKMYELTSTSESLPLRAASLSPAQDSIYTVECCEINQENPLRPTPSEHQATYGNRRVSSSKSRAGSIVVTPRNDMAENLTTPVPLSARILEYGSRPHLKSRTISTPQVQGIHASSKTDGSKQYPLPPPSPKFPKSVVALSPLQISEGRPGKNTTSEDPMPSPMPFSIPAPPFSLPTYLQLELSSNRPSPLYIHRSATSDFPYESSRVKIERLQNVFLLPFQLEQVLWFGALACLDAWLFSFTILPLRFIKALSILFHSWGINLWKEFRHVSGFIYYGTGRWWRRRWQPCDNTKNRDKSMKSETSSTTSRVLNLCATENSSASHSHPEPDRTSSNGQKKKRYRSKSTPSALLPDHKADILKGFLILMSCTILMYFDASRMYHGIRGQAAIKLYVIYNVLEVCDRLFSALGQDVLECLFSKETLERKPDGRSKILRPLWLFTLALLYNLIHATSLFYQVITLNVAVNSYSNALLTLLMSNQFVEIKSTVFKKFEKENLFQLTCADVVERFQLWLMLTIIASRNIIETGAFSLGLSGSSGSGSSPNTGSAAPLTGSSILPTGFMMLPPWTQQVIGPFVLVLGSEMVVDWVKHAYITKFNNTTPAIYGRFLDVLAKDYYSNAFADQNLTRRLGLPVIPLASLFIRASVQTYHMFLATHVPLPIPSPATSLSLDSAPTTSNPATTAALQHIDHIVRRALGRSTFGAGGSSQPSFPSPPSSLWTSDDLIAFLTMLTFFSLLFLVLLAFKLVLGMCLLSFARHRYRGMKEREQNTRVHADGKRVGGWGVVEVGEDKRRWIYQDDPDGAKQLRDREEKSKGEGERGGWDTFGRVRRYSMVAKRIW